MATSSEVAKFSEKALALPVASPKRNAYSYSFSDEVDVYSQPRCWKFEHLGPAKLTHDAENGFILEGTYRGEKYYIQRMPLQINSLHVEYDFGFLDKADCFDISTENDSFYCVPTYKDCITKLAFATEEIYLRSLAKK